MVTGRQHRVAALSHLGYIDIPVILEKGLIQIIDFSQISELPLVKNNLFELKDAQTIFNRFFEKDNLVNVLNSFGIQI